VLDEKQAIAKAKAVFPEGDIKWVIDYRDSYLFLIYDQDPLEGDQDPFYIVNKDTGVMRDFSILEDGDINEITRLVQAKKGG